LLNKYQASVNCPKERLVFAHGACLRGLRRLWKSTKAATGTGEHLLLPVGNQLLVRVQLGGPIVGALELRNQPLAEAVALHQFV
jgi:hypothetical protein